MSYFLESSPLIQLPELELQYFMLYSEYYLSFSDSTGVLPQFAGFHQVSSTISISAPVSSVSTDGRDESPSEKNELQIKHEQTNRHFKMVIHEERGRQVSLSPGSALSLRRSPRFQVPSWPR